MMVAFDSVKLIDTIGRVVAQVEAEFPKADLLQVGKSVMELAHKAEARSTAIQKTNPWLRFGIILVLALGFSAGFFVVNNIRRFPDTGDLFTMFQGLEAVLNVVILSGAAIFSIVTIETRWQRNAALKEINAVVSLIHIIDMHQLGKHAMIAEMRNMTRNGLLKEEFYTLSQINRYFDFCSDLMSLAAKITLIYEEKLPDSVISDAVTDAAQLATALSNETYQKMMLIDRAAFQAI
jgi:hypothetical protein